MPWWLLEFFISLIRKMDSAWQVVIHSNKVWEKSWEGREEVETETAKTNPDFWKLLNASAQSGSIPLRFQARGRIQELENPSLISILWIFLFLVFLTY